MPNIIHTLNRGVDKRKIFLEQQDYLRFVHDLFEFNDEENASTTYYAFQKLTSSQDVNIGTRPNRQPRKLLVQLLAFVLMPNHYHLLMIPKADGNVTRFMKKLNMGYARYFNEKYERQGALFQGRYKNVVVKDDAHFIHLPYYIHCNPLDLKHPEWRERRIRNAKDVMAYLNEYRWSSHPDYAGIKNFPSVTQRELLLEFFGGIEGYQDKMFSWLKSLDIPPKTVALE